MNEINFIEHENLIYSMPKRTDDLKITDEEFIVNQIKEKKIQPPILYNLYSLKFQRDYDLEDENSSEIESYWLLEKTYKSLDEFNNDKTTSRSKRSLRKQIFYRPEHVINLYKNDPELKLEHLLPLSINLKEWRFK